MTESAVANDPAFLLIHGSAHGAWCWRDLLAELHSRGFEARAIDLPSQADDPADLEAVGLNEDRDAILADIASHEDRPVVLVGHSAGGYAITAAAEAAPDKVAALVYLCAYVPVDGISLADLRRSAKSQPVLGLIERTRNRQAYRFKPDAGGEALCHDCSDDVRTYVTAHLGAQAIRPQETALAVTTASTALPRHYILCEHDRVIPPAEQRTMCAGWPEASVHTLPCGHSPYFAAPKRLADTLAGILHQAG
ncbi:alpha/beta fold hydrolase [Celeribacter sp. ULVN23_4]